MGSSSLNADVKRIRQTPNGWRPEFLISGLEVQVVYGRASCALDERLVDHLDSDILNSLLG
jgi:hypothetical protein